MDEDKIIIKFISNKINNLKEELIEDIKNGNDLIITKNNELKISLTSSDNKTNKNKTIIDLGECGNKLKDFYNISKNESLLILKIEVTKKDMKKPRIEYEVYYPLNENKNKLYKLDLSICGDTNIKILNPMKYDFKNIDIYNSIVISIKIYVIHIKVIKEQI